MTILRIAKNTGHELSVIVLHKGQKIVSASPKTSQPSPEATHICRRPLNLFINGHATMVTGPGPLPKNLRSYKDLNSWLEDAKRSPHVLVGKSQEFLA